MVVSIRNPVIITCISGLLFIGSILILFLYPIQTSTSVWKGYRVLVVSLSVNENDITSRLQKQGITEFITESNTLLKNQITEAPIQPILSKINESRSAWFINVTQKNRYIYLKDIPFLDSRIQAAFSGTDYVWNLESGGGGVTFIPSLLCFLFVIIGLFVSKNYLYQLFCSLPFVFLAVSCNTILGCIISLFSIYSLILLLELLSSNGKVISKKQILQRVYRQKRVFIPICISFVSAIIGGWQSVLLFLAALTASLISTYFISSVSQKIEIIQSKNRIHPVFRPQLMHQSIPEIHLKRSSILIVSSVSLILVIIGVLFFSLRTQPFNNSDNDLYIPAPARYTVRTGFDIEGYTELLALKDSSGLPDLSDFLAAQWQIYTFPYQRVQNQLQKPKNGSIVLYNNYTIDKNGLITPKKQIMNTFNTEFIKKRLFLDSTPLEKMLLKQNKFVTVGQKSSNDTRTKSGNSIFLIYLIYILIPGAAIFMRLNK